MPAFVFLIMAFVSDVFLFYLHLLLVFLFCLVFFFKQKTAYEMRISDWSSDVCSSDLLTIHRPLGTGMRKSRDGTLAENQPSRRIEPENDRMTRSASCADIGRMNQNKSIHRSEEHTSELQSLMSLLYDVFCLKQKKIQNNFL